MNKQKITIGDKIRSTYLNHNYEEGEKPKYTPRTWHYCSKVGRLVYNNLIENPCNCRKYIKQPKASLFPREENDNNSNNGVLDASQRHSPLSLNVKLLQNVSDDEMDRTEIDKIILSERNRTQSMGHMQMEPFEGFTEKRKPSLYI